jgi:hypothetical protein
MTGIKVVVVVIVVVKSLSTVSHWVRATANRTGRPRRSMMARRSSPAATHSHLLLTERHFALSQLHFAVSQGVLIAGDRGLRSFGDIVVENQVRKLFQVVALERSTS